MPRWSKGDLERRSPLVGAARPATVQAAVAVKELVGARAGMRPALLVALCGAWCAAAAVAEVQVCRVGLEKVVRASVPLAP